MASFEVGTILINTGHNNHTAGDKIEVFYDLDSASFVVEENDVVVTDLDGIWEFVTSSVYTFRYNTGFSFLQDGAKKYFSPISAFPFYEVNSTPIVGTGINDVAISVSSITESSGSGTNDGTITVTATGTNTPFQYSKDGSNFQSSGTFASLYDGNYTITVRDSLGYTDSINVLLDILDVVPESTNIKYRIQFDEVRPENPTRDGTKHRVDILLLGYTDSINEVEAGSTPLLINARAEGNQPGVDVTAVSHELSINLLAESAGQYREFATANEYSYLVKYYVDDSAGKDGTDYNLRFQGYITPESYVEEYYQAPYLVSISASDRIGDLGSMPYEPTKNTKYSGLSNEISIINNCLSKLKLSQPYRLAVNIYEDTMSTSNTSPLHQAYVQQDVYYDGGSPKTCGDVIRAILQPYGAVLFSWGGYFYIIKEEEWQNTSISYNQFDTDLVYDTNGTISPRISFKSFGNTNLFRFAGRQSLTFTRPVKNVNIIADTAKRDTGIVEPLNENTIKLEPYVINVGNESLANLINISSIKGFRGYELVVGNNLFQRADRDTDGKYFWSISMVDELPSVSYIRASKSLTHSSNDKLELRFKVRVNFNIGGIYVGISPGTPAAYLLMKWMLKVGDKYLQVDGSWSTSQTINQFFIEKDDVNKFVDFSIDANFPPDVTDATEETYELRLYPVSAWEYDTLIKSSGSGGGTQVLSFSGSATATNRTNMIDALKTASNDYVAGSRAIARYNVNGTDYWYYCYYECGSENSPSNDGIDRIVFTNNSSRYWDLKYTWYEQVVSGSGVLSGRTTTDIKEIGFFTYPNGVEAPDNYELVTKTNGAENNKDLNITLFHFDLPDTINNDENIYLNYTRLSDGSPTGTWTKTGGVISKYRQEHLADRLFSLYKQPRYQMNFSAYSDVEWSILNHLYVSGDNGRIFVLNGIEVDPKTGLHSGEILEIYNTGQPVVGEFNNDFDIDNEYA